MTYARRLYDLVVDLNRIRQNLGHHDIQTTLGYIGEGHTQGDRWRIAITKLVLFALTTPTAFHHHGGGLPVESPAAIC